MDLIICSQSLHWLDIPKFYLEADRVLCSETGVLAVFGYHPMGLSPEFNYNLTPNQISLVECLRDKIYNMVYWAPEIRLSYEEAYKTIQASDGSGIVAKTWVQIFEVPLEVLKGQVEERIFASFGFLANFDDLSKFEHAVLSIN